jgi:uncharacterized protein YggE
MRAQSLLAAASLVGLLAPHPAFALDEAPASLPATLMVSGHAGLSRAPDRAQVRAQIETSAASAEEARAKNDGITARVVRAISALGLPERSLRTADFRSSYVPREKDTPSDALTGYVAVREIEVTTPPGNLEAVTNTLNGAGVREIEGVSTSLSQTKQAYDTTLAAAMNDAREQAQAITRAAHLRIVRIRKIEVVQVPMFAPHMERSMLAEAKAPAPPDLDLSATLNVTYEIAPSR